jgi:hydrogenase maturation protease
MSRVTVLVLGEMSRGDDGAAQAAVSLLPEQVRHLADLRISGQLDPAVLLELTPDRPLLIVDAMHGPAAGSIRAWSLEELATRATSAERHALPSTHALPVTDTLALALVITGRAPRGRLVALAGVNFGLGSGLSPEVAGALRAFAEAIGDEITTLATDPRFQEPKQQCA